MSWLAADDSVSRYEKLGRDSLREVQQAAMWTLGGPSVKPDTSIDRFRGGVGGGGEDGEVAVCLSAVVVGGGG